MRRGLPLNEMLLSSERWGLVAKSTHPGELIRKALTLRSTDAERGHENQVLGSIIHALNGSRPQFPHIRKSLQLQQEAENVCKATTPLERAIQGC